jgi:predicted AlkP superfamily pyrophosphatase or phosphodiesterase
VTAWERSPLNDEFLTGMAIDLLQAKQLGMGEGIDLLALSLPSLDHEGHEYGPRSFEVQDVLARLDVDLGRLLEAIEAQVGTNYVLGLSSDHGVALLPEQALQRVATLDDSVRRRSGLRSNAAVQQILGDQGSYVAAIYEQQIALVPGVLDQLRAKPGGLRAVKTALTNVTGIAAAYSADDLFGASTDAGAAAWRLSYVPGRSGDFLFTPKPNWIVIGATGTTHGTLNAYDQRVPLVIFGTSIRPGQYKESVTPADLAPTFAFLAGITMPRAQGRALTQALKSASHAELPPPSFRIR